MSSEQWQKWVGNLEESSDTLVTTPAGALHATLDHASAPPRHGEPLPPLWHWLYFLPWHRQSELGPDGHAKRGGFLPPVAPPRRMWAGGRLTFHTPLRMGAQATRQSRILSVAAKSGRSGQLVFVTVRHTITTAGGLALTEEQDIVYREAPAPGAPAPKPVAPPGDSEWRRELIPDEVLLFRYSALTFNGHRIHYDRRFCTEHEGYPGLVVHGPLIATLLVDQLRRAVPDVDIKSFQFRAVSPLFDGVPLFLCGRREGCGGHATLWAENARGELAMQAAAEIG